MYTAPGGSPFIEQYLRLMLTEVSKGPLDPRPGRGHVLLRPGQADRLPRHQGAIQVGADADLVVLDMDDEDVLHADQSHYRAAGCPARTSQSRADPVLTVLRGRRVMRERRRSPPRPGPASWPLRGGPTADGARSAETRAPPRMAASLQPRRRPVGVSPTPATRSSSSWSVPASRAPTWCSAGREGSAAFMAEAQAMATGGLGALRVDAWSRLDRAGQRRRRGDPGPGADGRDLRPDRDGARGVLHPPGGRPRCVFRRSRSGPGRMESSAGRHDHAQGAPHRDGRAARRGAPHRAPPTPSRRRPADDRRDQRRRVTAGGQHASVCTRPAATPTRTQLLAAARRPLHPGRDRADPGGRPGAGPAGRDRRPAGRRRAHGEGRVSRGHRPGSRASSTWRAISACWELPGHSDLIVAAGFDPVELIKPWQLRVPVLHMDTTPNTDQVYPSARWSRPPATWRLPGRSRIHRRGPVDDGDVAAHRARLADGLLRRAGQRPVSPHRRRRRGAGGLPARDRSRRPTSARTSFWSGRAGGRTARAVC